MARWYNAQCWGKPPVRRPGPIRRLRWRTCVRRNRVHRWTRLKDYIAEPCGRREFSRAGTADEGSPGRCRKNRGQTFRIFRRPARAPFGASSLINGVVSAIVGGTERVACSTTEHATRSTTGLGDFALPFPAFYLTLSLFAGVAIALLELAHQDLAVALDLIDFILGELAPLLPHLPLELSPLAFQRVTVHVTSIRRDKPMPCRTCP